MDGVAAGTRARGADGTLGMAGQPPGGTRMSILHHHVAGQGFTRWAMLLFIGLFLIHLGDFIGQSGDYVESLGAGRGEHLLHYLALRFPSFLAAWLPVSVAGAALLTAWPMMRQGTLVALCAAGIPVRRIFAGLLGLALGVGVLGFVLQDQIIPRLEPEVRFAKARMQGKLKLGESVGRTLAWHDSGLYWCAQHAYAEDGRYLQVAVFGDAGARHRGLLVMADALTWKDGGWRLIRPVVVNNYHTPVTVREECTPAEIGLTLSADLATLVEQVKQDRTRTSDQLFSVGSDNAAGYLWLRLSFGLLPLLCLLFALPGFIRLEGRHHLGLAIGRAMVWMAIPLVGYWVLARILVSNSTYVLIGTAVVLGGLGLAGAWRWWTMRV
jgi:lipopolysaccharide export LptBFGC system permease protein LptF